jgi:hypothetical protein
VAKVVDFSQLSASTSAEYRAGAPCYDRHLLAPALSERGREANDRVRYGTVASDRAPLCGARSVLRARKLETALAHVSDARKRRDEDPWPSPVRLTESSAQRVYRVALEVAEHPGRCRASLP